MSESPVEHFEHAEHAEHAALLGDPFLAQVAVTIAILAVIAATVGSLETLETAAAIGDKNAAVLLENKATDTWNFYQLRDTDLLLRDQGRSGLKACRVKGANNPDELRRLVPVSGWRPVETQVHISDIPRIVEMFGGTSLYGADSTVPVRERSHSRC